MEIKTVTMEIPEGANIIIGQTHFIKTAEDLYEVMVNAVPWIKFVISFLYVLASFGMFLW